jgi:DNA processing protein
MVENDELTCTIALSGIPKVGPTVAKNLIAYCGSAAAVFKTPATKLRGIPGIGVALATEIKNANVLDEAARAVDNLHKKGILAIAYNDARYPQRLCQQQGSPLVLYTKGNTNLNHHRMVGIVGTRQPTDYGKAMCEQMVESLAPYGVVIVSGLAYGIDATAHRKSVQLDIPTIGILGHGLDIIYPAAHASLVRQMTDNGGVMTEFPIGTLPDKENFPMRNRIIAGLSDAVIVIESKSKGGSIITAEFANDFNKDVFAVPGLVTEEKAQGCHDLIKANKAHLAENGKDIAAIMRWDALDERKVIQPQLFPETTESEDVLLGLLRNQSPMSIDTITYRLQYTPSVTASLLLSLEFKGLIRSLPGKYYTLT